MPKKRAHQIEWTETYTIDVDEELIREYFSMSDEVLVTQQEVEDFINEDKEAFIEFVQENDTKGPQTKWRYLGVVSTDEKD